MGDPMTRLIESLGRMSRFYSLLASFLSTVLVGVLDYLTGFEFGFSIFYLIPVTLSVWTLGREWATAVSAFCAVSWFLADLAAGHTYSHLLIPYWNALIRFGFFLIIALALHGLRASLQREKELARKDSLTGLANALGFYELANIELDRSRRFRRPLALAYLDCDDLKRVNDTLGHLVGSEVLRVIGKTMRRSLRAYDIPARIGGDEFVILLPETDPAGALAVIERLRREILNALSQRGWGVTMSIGVATLSGLEGLDAAKVDDLIKKADALMYEAKNSGKDSVRWG